MSEKSNADATPQCMEDLLLSSEQLLSADNGEIIAETVRNYFSSEGIGYDDWDAQEKRAQEKLDTLYAERAKSGWHFMFNHKKSDELIRHWKDVIKMCRVMKREEELD